MILIKGQVKKVCLVEPKKYNGKQGGVARTFKIAKNLIKININFVKNIIKWNLK